jgi:pimeloyl-ACP methyl ester carboxylesterase
MATIEPNQARIAYTETGAGEPVLLLHCSSACGSEWHGLCDTLGGDFHVIAPDQWGCGKSDPWTGRGTFSLAEEAAPILDIIHDLGRPVHLVGHSYGGGLALRIARKRPDLVRSLTLVEPSCFHLLRQGHALDRALFGEIARVAGDVKDAVASGDYWGGMARFVDYWNGAGAWQEMSHGKCMKLSQRLGKVVLDFRALFEEPASLAAYAALTMPTLILCGDRSPGPSRRIVDMLVSAMPRARLEPIPDAGHMSPMTHPDFVNAAIASHLRLRATGAVPLLPQDRAA